MIDSHILISCLFYSNVCILLSYIFFFDSKYLFFAHAYEFGVNLVILSGVSEWKNRIIFIFAVVMCYLI